MKLRRMLFVALAYGAGVVALDILLRSLVPLLVLPPLFLTLARGLLALGFVVLMAATWSYGSTES